MRNSKSIILPNRETLKLDNVISFSNHFPLQFYQYEGFKGKYHDLQLNDFVLIFKEQKAASLVGFNFLDDVQIEKLKYKKIAGIRFDKIPDCHLSFGELKSYLQDKYADCGVREIHPIEKDVDKAVLLYNKENGEEYCIIQYIKFGIPGSFIIMI